MPSVYMNRRPIEIWRVYNENELPARAMGLLSVEETRQASRFVRPTDSRSYVATRSALRVLLARCTGLRPEMIGIEAGEYGKPRLIDPDLRTKHSFNVSHTRGLALIAIGNGEELGVDVQRHREDMDIESLLARCFTVGEIREVMKATAESRPKEFVRLWVRKEAYLKAIGRGLSGGLRTFTVSLDREQMVGGWKILELETPVNFAAAMAMRQKECTTRVADFDFQAFTHLTHN